MKYTPLDFYPPTGSKGARYIIEDKLQEFNGVAWEVVADEAEQASALANLAADSPDAPSEEPAQPVTVVPPVPPAVTKPTK